jgi:5-hydroxyisourate hydrolase-like protein (transthyretin family)
VRVRPLLLVAAIFGAAAAAAAFVVAQLPREGQESPPARVAVAPAEPGETPPLEPPATEADGALELLVTAGGEPRGGAELRLYAQREDGWRRAGTAVTGPDGRARIPARTGAYLVAARAAGLAAARAEVVRAAGAEVTRAELALEPPGALHGRVSGPAGEPLESARLRALPLVSRWPGFAPPSAPHEEIAVAASDAAGAFRIEGLAPGAYALAADAPGRHPALLPRVAVPADALAVVLEPLARVEGVVLRADGTPAAGADVRAASADHGARATSGADGAFALPAPAGSYRLDAALHGDAASATVSLAAGGEARGLTLRLGPGAAVEGEVTLASGRPAAGAEVAVLRHETRELAARAAADASGRFRLAGLAPGAWDVRATAPGATPALAAGVTLSAGATFPLRLVLEGTGSAEGTVRDPRGRPLAGVAVRVARAGDGAPGATWLEARSGFDGAWRLDGLAIGRAALVARQPGVALGDARSVQVEAGRVARADFVLPAAGLLAGRVRLPSGAPPPAGTTVSATPTDAGLGAAQVARAAVDATGNYRLALPAGAYRVQAAPAAPGRTDPRARPAFARVDPERTTPLDVTAPPAAPEGGVDVLVLEPGGAPSPGALVTLARADDARPAFASAAGDDGRVALGAEMGLAGRRAVVRARNGGRIGAAEVEVPPSGTVTVRLEPGGAVRGVVRAAGAAPRGFTLEVASQPAASSWRTVDVHRFAGDRFELGDLPAEPLRLVVRADDGRRGQAEVALAPGEVRAVEIALR